MPSPTTTNDEAKAALAFHAAWWDDYVATNAEALLGLGRGRFDAAVCTMALMDIPTILLVKLLAGTSQPKGLP